MVFGELWGQGTVANRRLCNNNLMKVSCVVRRLACQVLCFAVLFALLVRLASAEECLVLEQGQFVIVLPCGEPEALQLAVRSLARDFKAVVGAEPEIVDSLERAGGRVALIVVNNASPKHAVSPKSLPPLDGFESHRVLADSPQRAVYLHGSDLRGTIYAIYTFSEKLLGVPPLWYFCSWQPAKQEHILVPSTTNLFFKSPQVRYRAWFPNDTDMFSPWRKLSDDNNVRWLETMLRLKLNAVECGATIHTTGRMNTTAETLSRFGLIVTSTHTVALNNSFSQWDDYWKTVRQQTVPVLALANEKEIVEFFRYSIETVHSSGVESLWQIGFRGQGDRPFWTLFADAPTYDRERAEVINRMMRIQLDLIKEITGEQAPYVRVTFYDELSDFLAADYLKPPQEKNVIWTFCSARRDHYPNEDFVNFVPTHDVKIGYYMNLQFTSTGSHLAPAEGPWKMEFNYRYVNGKAPLYFSVLNAGNLREHLLGLSANAAMLWDFDTYSTDRFVVDYCKMYFDEQHASEIATLYKDFFDAYWQPTRPVFPGMKRQFLFQDLRYARAFRMIGSTFFNFTPEPLHDIGYERTPGRSFRISPKDNNADNSIDAILNGMKETVANFESVAKRCDEVENHLPEKHRLFFYDNLGGFAHFMEHLSRSFQSYVSAYKNRTGKATVTALEVSLEEMRAARSSLLRMQHGVFEHWYDGDTTNGKFNMPATIKRIEATLDSAILREGE